MREREEEVAPLKVHKTVLLQWRPEKDPTAVKVQIRLRLERPRPPKPDPQFLVFIDLNSVHGLVVAYVATNGLKTRILEVNHYYPPNQGQRRNEAKKRQRAIARGGRGVNDALLCRTLRFDSSGWLKSVASKVIRKALKRAAASQIMVHFDAPPSGILCHSCLQGTLISFKKILKNLCAWYGIHLQVHPLPSTRCPHCGGKLKEVYRSKRVRVMSCDKCAFEENRDLVPLHWYLKKLRLPVPPTPVLPLPPPPPNSDRQGDGDPR